MDIRTISIGVSLKQAKTDDLFARMGSLASEARRMFVDQDIMVRTVRGYSEPIPSLGIAKEELTNYARNIETECRNNNIDWFCLPGGKASSWDDLSPLLDMLAGNKNIFSNLDIASNNRIDILGIKKSVSLISDLAKVDDGFANFRFCVNANIKPNGAYFPSAWHQGENSFAIALEHVDLAIQAAEKASDLFTFRELWIRALDRRLEKIEKICQTLEQQHGFKFAGIDLTLSPFPEDNQSVGRLVQLLTGAKFGDSKTLFATAFLTNILQGLRVRGVGFNGLIYSPLEDQVLAERAIKGSLNIDKLLNYITVCGAGLDMLPVAGDVSAEELANKILDVAAISDRLNKPLVARLLPVLGKKEGGMTGFGQKSEFIADTKIMKIADQGNLIDKTANYTPLLKGRNRNNSYKDNSKLYDLVEDIPGEQAQYKKAAEEINNLCQNNEKTVIDFCCGTASIANLLRGNKNVEKIIGIDICSDYLEKAREKIGDDVRYQFMAGDAVNCRLPFQADIVLASSAYHHIEDERKLEFLNNIHRHLKKDGQVVFCENFIGDFNNLDEYSEKTREFYEKRIDELMNLGIKDERLELLREVLGFGVNRIYEWKSSFRIFAEHLEKCGFEIVKATKVWPDPSKNYFADNKIGDFVVIARKKGVEENENLTDQHAQRRNGNQEHLGLSARQGS